MTAITATSTVRGNISLEPKVFPAKENMPATVKLRIAVNQRRRNLAGGWENGATTYVQASLRGTAAQAAAILVNEGTLGIGTPVIAVGAVADKPDVYTGKDGTPQASPVLLVDAIGVDVIRLQQRDAARASAPAAVPQNQPAGVSAPTPQDDGFFTQPEVPSFD